MNYVSQDTVRIAVIGAIAIVAVAMGAATIDTTVTEGVGSTGVGDVIDDESPSSGGGANDGGDSAGVGGIGNGSESQGIVAEITTCVRPLSAWYGTLVYFGAVVGLLYGIKRRYSTGASFLAMYAASPVILISYFLATDCPTASPGGGGESSFAENIGGMAGQEVIPTNVPPWLIVGVFALALVVTVAVVYRASGDQYVAGAEETEEDELDKPDVTDLAAAAGAAADRLEKHNADVDNEVYRAWWEMTSLLQLEKPDSATPGEFATAAVEAGLDEDDVGQLTQLFEEVRYGRRDPESREERALSVFRSIEEEYGVTHDDTTGDER